MQKKKKKRLSVRKKRGQRPAAGKNLFGGGGREPLFLETRDGTLKRRAFFIKKVLFPQEIYYRKGREDISSFSH